jgi:hypothetical protein
MEKTMTRLLALHVGGIDTGRERLYTSFKGTRAEILYDLNNWLFDYLYAHQLPIVQLPPLDDWIHSTEDVSFWSFNFPTGDLSVWLRSELIDFVL